MKEICIPISHFGDEEIAEVIVKVGNNEEKFHFRVESFPWKTTDQDELNEEEYLTESLRRIYGLKRAIQNYDKQWELIQIFTPAEDATHIHVLYRKKKGKTHQQNQLIS